MSGGGDDETWLGDATYTDEVPLPAAVVEVPLLAGRYRVGGLLGRGGTGQVHEAVDTTSDEVVAIKFVSLRSKGARRQLRQELTSLRLLALPGVVRLHDDGEDGDQTFLVMDLLPGGGFDRLARHGWDGWQEQARALLESLARVHFAGVLHLDLKPGNILLDAAERPVITDFGLARGRSVHNPEDAPREGTPRYMAPEQWRGEEPTAATDLYAVGGIFWEMLAGRALPKDPGARGLASDCAPEGVRSTVMAMLAEDPAERPQGVVEVLEALFDVSAVLGPADLELPELATAEALESLFDEEQPTFLHLARDAAKVLHQITGGERAKVRAELDRWVLAGLAWWNEERVHIERPAIEQLQWGLDPESRRLADLIRNSPEEAVGSAVLLADAHRKAGRVNRAVGVLEALLPLARSLGMAADVSDRLVEASLNRASALDRALHHAVRDGSDATVRLVRGVRAHQDGNWALSYDLLSPLLGCAPAHLSEAVGAFCCQSVRWGRPDEYRSWILNLVDVLSPSLVHGAHAADAYGRGEYAEAVEGFRLAAECDDWVRRMGALTNATAAAVEIRALESAEQLLARVVRELRDTNAPLLSVRAHWLQRLVAYRLHESRDYLPEFVEPAALVSRRMAAQLAMLEAASGWREGRAEAEEPARKALEWLRMDGHESAYLAEALLAALLGDGEICSVEAYRGLSPDFSVQALALAVLAGAVVGDVEETIRRAERGRAGLLDLRLEVVSVSEAVEVLRTGALRGVQRGI